MKDSGDPGREALEDALTGWAAQRADVDTMRDFLVRAAVAGGVSKHRVHVLTGLARTTIDAITQNGRQAT